MTSFWAAVATFSPVLLGQASAPARAPARPSTWGDWLSEPRSLVFAVLIVALVVGGGLKLWQARQARRLASRLREPGVEPEEIREAAKYGRAVLPELVDLLDPKTAPPVRDAAGATLAVLWAQDELIPEEEKGIVTRGFDVRWHARRRYPRDQKTPIPVEIRFGVPFLGDDGPGVKVGQLEWSYRVAGAQRASMERFSPWQAGPVRVVFTLEPADFATNGPHRLSLQAKVRTVGLTSAWEMDLPHSPFSFEFDPNLSVDSLLTAPDSSRAERLAQSVQLRAPEIAGDDPEPRFIPITEELALRDPPELVVTDPPCDLAHAVAIEFEGIPGLFPAGSLIVSRDRLRSSTGPQSPGAEATTSARFPLVPESILPSVTLDRPGEHRLRAVLTADPHLGWADPDVRSLWPGTVTTDWAEVRVIRL
jgi:hypothetical protein